MSLWAATIARETPLLLATKPEEGALAMRQLAEAPGFLLASNYSHSISASHSSSSFTLSLSLPSTRV